MLGQQQHTLPFEQEPSRLIRLSEEQCMVGNFPGLFFGTRVPDISPVGSHQTGRQEPKEATSEESHAPLWG